MIDDHVILCGLGRVGWHVLELLNAAGTPVVVIDSRCATDDPRLGSATLVQGDCQNQAILERAGVLKARGVVILPSDELVSTTTALMVRRLNPTARVVVRMFNQNLIARLGSSVSNVVALSTSALVAPLLALIARTGDALGTFRLDDGKLQQIAELTCRPGSPLLGARVSSLLENQRLVVLAHTKGAQTRLLRRIDIEEEICPGDRLVVCGEAGALAPFLYRDEEESLPELL